MNVGRDAAHARGQMAQLYDAVAAGYRDHRRADPRIAAAITAALGDAVTVINVGAGAGSYEPQDREVVAVEPSALMIAQRPYGSAPAVQGTAMALPFGNDAFDAAMAILTIHHWPDRARGLNEMKRVARGTCVVLTWEPPEQSFWLTADYLPHFFDADRVLFPPWFRRDRTVTEVRPVLVPGDCTDGFLCAYWRRPDAYLDPAKRDAISTFSRVGNFEAGLAQLRSDLDDGTWHRLHGNLLDLEDLDLGYRLVSLRNESLAIGPGPRGRLFHRSEST